MEEARNTNFISSYTTSVGYDFVYVEVLNVNQCKIATVYILLLNASKAEFRTQFPYLENNRI